MDITSALSYIHAKSRHTTVPGLSRMKELAEKIGRPDKKLKFVHVAGTNGKGSTCALIASAMQRAGYKTGLFTSPHITSFNERFRINGKNISDRELCEITEYIKPAADNLANGSPNEFELICAIGLEYFYRNSCDIVIFEVGLGGLYDATNIIDAPEAAVITAIGLDHTALLGNTPEQIAQNKAGIIKHGCDVVVYDCEKSIYGVIKDKCEKQDCRLYTADFSKLSDVRTSLDGAVFNYGSLKNVKIGLCGAYQPCNAAVALKTLEILKKRGFDIPDKAIYDGFCDVRWQGRFEIIRKKPYFILDGSHNPQGLNAAISSLEVYFPKKKCRFLIGVMADKDVSGIAAALIPKAESIIAVKPDNPRAMDACKLKSVLEALGAQNVSAASSIKDAVSSLLSGADDDSVCVCIGSLYLISDARRAYIESKGKE